MSKDMLGNNAAEVQRFIAGPIADLTGKSFGRNSRFWQNAVKRLARRDPKPFGENVYVVELAPLWENCDRDAGTFLPVNYCRSDLQVETGAAKFEALVKADLPSKLDAGGMHMPGEIIFRLVQSKDFALTKESAPDLRNLLRYGEREHLEEVSAVEALGFVLAYGSLIYDGSICIPLMSAAVHQHAGHLHLHTVSVRQEDEASGKYQQKVADFWEPPQPLDQDRFNKFSSSHRFLLKETER